MKWFKRLVEPTQGKSGMELMDQIQDLPPRAWWDQRGIIDASAPEQPQYIDMTDVNLVNASYRRGKRR